MMKVEITRGRDGRDTVAALGSHDQKGAFRAVRAWAVAHAGYRDVQDAVWGFTRKPDGTAIVDFGSHELFARFTPEGTK